MLINSTLDFARILEHRREDAGKWVAVKGEQYRHPENEIGITVPVLLRYDEKIIPVEFKEPTGLRLNSPTASKVREHGHD
jgi:hypothetical protein